MAAHRPSSNLHIPHGDGRWGAAAVAGGGGATSGGEPPSSRGDGQSPGAPNEGQSSRQSCDWAAHKYIQRIYLAQSPPSYIRSTNRLLLCSYISFPRVQSLAVYFLLFR